MIGNIHSFESFGTVDGPGIRFVVFMQGCPMRCKYCHNPDTWSYSGGMQISCEEVAAKALKYISYFTGGGGVTVSGGEPMLQLGFVTELFKILKTECVHTALDTSGILFNPADTSAVDELLKYTDLVLLDLKHIDEEEHVKLCGHSNKNVLAFASYLSEIGKPMWVRHVLVPGITDSDDYLCQTKYFINGLNNVKRVEVLPYHTMGLVKYTKLGYDYPLCGVQPPTKERVQNARKILGLK